MQISKSYSEFNFRDINENNDLLNTWFEYDEDSSTRRIRRALYTSISELSHDRRKPHTPEWFEKHLSTVYFHYVNKQLVPYKYTTHR